MSYQQLKKRTEGFTIIEVLIVLAIAGLILLIVFLAVPALQRNSRNTSYRSESSQLLAAATEFTNNNGGTAPAPSDTAVTCGSAGSYTCDAGKIVDLTRNKNVTGLKVEAQTAAPTGPTLSKATLQTGAKCNGQTASTAGATRQFALFYAIEDKSGNPTTQCVDA